jgi:hypothetical protein
MFGARKRNNRVLFARRRLEEKFLATLKDEVLKPEVLAAIHERTAEKIKEQFAHVPAELRLKKVELNRAETRVHNFIEFIASGRATAALADALAQAEAQVKTLTADVASMTSAADHAFTPPPKAWIADRVKHLNDLLATRTEQSALALRRLTGSVTLQPEKPEVGRPCFRVRCKVNALNLLRVAEDSSNSFRWWRRRESNPGPQGIPSTLIHVRSRSNPRDGVGEFGHHLASEFSRPATTGATSQAQP